MSDAAKTAIRIIQTQMILPRMQEKGISQYELAKRTGLAASSITRWFKGEMGISSENLIKILTALELNIHIIPKELDKIKYKNLSLINN